MPAVGEGVFTFYVSSGLSSAALPGAAATVAAAFKAPGHAGWQRRVAEQRLQSVLDQSFGLDHAQQGLLLLFGCLPPAVLNFMVAEQFQQEPGKVASIVLIGNVMAIVFIPLGLALALH